MPRGVLQTILAAKREELPELRRRALPAPPSLRPVALRRQPGERLRLIAEIKYRSPSAGPLSRALDVASRARAYEESGADMISVLCDARFFDGDYQHLSRAREACALPLLCKEFVLDECQLDAARAYGADAVLLIVRCLSPEALPRLTEAARERGLEPLVEAFGQVEAQRALDAGARCIGINARDLDTLEIDVPGAAEVIAALPKDRARVQLSGLASAADVSRVAQGPADAALIGETLMREDDPRKLLAALSAATRPC